MAETDEIREAPAFGEGMPEVGTIGYYRYIGDGKAERDLLSQLLRGMARRLSSFRRGHRELVAERWRLCGDLDELDAQIGSVRDGVMQAIYDAGVHTEVCDDDSVPDMVRAALDAVARREVSR